MGKSTISMAIFHCYVGSPEGIGVEFYQPMIGYCLDDWDAEWMVIADVNDAEFCWGRPGILNNRMGTSPTGGDIYPCLWWV